MGRGDIAFSPRVSVRPCGSLTLRKRIGVEGIAGGNPSPDCRLGVLEFRCEGGFGLGCCLVGVLIWMDVWRGEGGVVGG